MADPMNKTDQAASQFDARNQLDMVQTHPGMPAQGAYERNQIVPTVQPTAPRGSTRPIPGMNKNRNIG